VSCVSILAAGRHDAVCERCEVADTPLRRLRGLLGRDRLDPGEGILLRPAPSIHTCFMKFAIDAVFVDRELAVVGVSESIRPWRFARARGAHSVIELAAGECRRLRITTGDRLVVAGHLDSAGGEDR
jgi:uncharacterized membrane protein (UPF0127 family)